MPFEAKGSAPSRSAIRAKVCRSKQDTATLGQAETRLWLSEGLMTALGLGSNS